LRGRNAQASAISASPIGTVPGDVVIGAAAYWDEVLVASVKAERRQAWASPARLGARDADCGPLGFAFRFDAPVDESRSITGLVAKPASTAGGLRAFRRERSGHDSAD
jgi:hypothetical protein